MKAFFRVPVRRRQAGDSDHLLSPGALELGARTVGHEGGVSTSFAVTGYPREVSAGWLEPLLTYPGRLDVSLHVEPVAPQIAASQIRRQLARLESESRSGAASGRLADFEAEAAADDATELAMSLARGYGRLFRVGLYLAVHAADHDELDAETQRVRAMCASLLLDVRPTTFRALQGWVTATLPLAIDTLRLRRTFDSHALAAAFPFTSPDLPCPPGDTPVLYGTNAYSSGVVVWDRFACPNYNSALLGTSGSGKSFFTKLEALRLLYHGVEIAIVDPEDEYRRLTEATGGTRIALGTEGVCFNPFDLPTGQDGDVLTRRALFSQTLIATMLDCELDGAQRAALDRAVLAAYEARGITTNPQSWGRPAPLLADLACQLEADDDPAGGVLAARLAPYVSGSYSPLFTAPTTTRPEGHLIVFSLRDLPEELKSVGTLLALDAIWRRVASSSHRRRRLVIVDEGWLLMKQPQGARFLYRLAKSARKYWCGLSIVTQDAADLLSSDLGQAIVSNAATQVLLRQSPQAIDEVSEAFALSEGERQFLLTADKGQMLLCAASTANGGGSSRAALSSLASDEEYDLVTTDPADLVTDDAEDEADPL